MTLPAAATPNLPTFPEIVQNRTGADTPPPPAPLADTSLPSPATPAANPPAAPAPPAPRLLSTRQLNAIPLILAGLPDDQVARQIGVRRQAVCRWRNQHPRFIAELNRQRQLLHANTLDRYHRLLSLAMDTFELAQTCNGIYLPLPDKLRAATTLLRAATRHTLAPPADAPPTNPDTILDDLLSHGITPSPDDSPADDDDDDQTPSPTPPAS